MDGKLVFYFDGGGMRGVYGAGVVTGMQELEEEEGLSIREIIKAMEGVSSGAWNEAYYLTGESHMGSTLYWEDFSSDFIIESRLELALGFAQRTVLGERIHQEENDGVVDAMKINRLIELSHDGKPLDYDALRELEIPFYAKVLNTETWETSYMDVREHPEKIMHATVCVNPYYCGYEEFDGERYIDGGLKEHIGLEDILERHPDSKIVVVSNRTEEAYEGRDWVSCFEGHSLSRMYGGRTSDLVKMLREKKRNGARDLRLAKDNDRVLLLQPSPNLGLSNHTTDVETLRRAHAAGVEDVKRELPRFHDF